MRDRFPVATLPPDSTGWERRHPTAQRHRQDFGLHPWLRRLRRSRSGCSSRLLNSELLHGLFITAQRRADIEGRQQVSDPFVEASRIDLGEFHQCRQDRVGGSGPQTTPARLRDYAAPLDHVVEIRLVGPAGEDKVNLLAQYHVSGPAGNADTTGLVDEELHEIPDDLEKVALRIEDHERTAAGDVFEGDLAVGVCAGRNHLPGGAADLHGPGTFGANHLEYLTKADAPLDFVDPRRGAIPGDAEQPSAFRFGRTHGRKPVGAPVHDPGRRGEGLNVVDYCRLAQETVLDGERRFQPWRSSLALTRLNE